MRTGSKLLAISIFLLPAGQSAFALGTMTAPAGCGGFNLFNVFAPITERTQEAGQLTCNAQAYRSAPRELQTCNSCKPVVENWKKKIPKAAEAAANADCAAAGTGSIASAGTVAGTRDQLVSFGNNRTNVGAGRTAQTTRAQNADSAKAEFETCKREIRDACMQGRGLMPADHRVVQAVHKACEDAARGAGQFADQKKQDSNGLGNLSQLMDAASKAMGPLAQMAQQQNQPSDMSGLVNPNGTSPSPPSGGSSTSPPEIQTAKLDSKDPAASPTVGFGNPLAASTVAAGTPGITGVGSGTAASSNPDALGAFGSNGLGGPATGGEVGASGGGSGGGGGGGGLNSSGSSRPGDGTAGAGGAGGDSGSGYEVNPGGGKAFVGLKASKAELDSVADGSLLGGETKLDDLGGRDLASEGEALNAGEGESPSMAGDSIFMRVRSKYSTLKGSGRI